MKQIFGVLITGLCLPLCMAAQSSLFVAQETFADGERETFAPPASLAWRVSSASAVQMQDRTLVLTAPTKGVATAVAHLAAPGEAVALPAGARLVAKLRLRVRGPIGGAVNGLRVGLLHVGAQRMARDGAVPSGVAEGYVVTVNPENGGIALRKRTTQSGAWIAALASGLYPALPPEGRAKRSALRDGETHELELVVQRRADGSGRLSASIAPAMRSRHMHVALDSGPVPAQFDTLLIALQTGLSSVALESVEIRVEPEA